MVAVPPVKFTYVTMLSKHFQWNHVASVLMYNAVLSTYKINNNEIIDEFILTQYM